MNKPQHKPCNDSILQVDVYPETMKALEESLREVLTECQMDDIGQMVDVAYKAGYLDGWKQALFWSDK